MVLTQDVAKRDKARLHRAQQEAHPRSDRVHVLDGRTRCHETDADHRGLGQGGADRHISTMHSVKLVIKGAIPPQCTG